MTPALRVVDLVGAALYQDAGRAHRSSGVPVSGAFDRHAHAAATALVGGPPTDATLELVGRIELAAAVALTCAVTGEARLSIDGLLAPSWTALALPQGARLSIDAPGRGYLGVAGGFRPESVLGSRSTCLLGPLGPPPVRQGDSLPLGPRPVAATTGDFCRPPARARTVRVVPGPHVRLAAATVRVVEQSRIGIRIRPPQLVPASVTLPSFGVLPGTIQVLPAGDWMVLGPDAGTMGGYPVVGVVCDVDLDGWAQARPGDLRDLVGVEPDECPRRVPVQVIRASEL